LLVSGSVLNSLHTGWFEAQAMFIPFGPGLPGNLPGSSQILAD